MEAAHACMRRDVRTSQGTFMTRREDPDGVLAWMEEKAAQVTGLPVYHGEVRVSTASLRNSSSTASRAQDFPGTLACDMHASGNCPNGSDGCLILPSSQNLVQRPTTRPCEPC